MFSTNCATLIKKAISKDSSSYSNGNSINSINSNQVIKNDKEKSGQEDEEGQQWMVFQTASIPSIIKKSQKYHVFIHYCLYQGNKLGKKHGVFISERKKTLVIGGNKDSSFSDQQKKQRRQRGRDLIVDHPNFNKQKFLNEGGFLNKKFWYYNYFFGFCATSDENFIRTIRYIDDNSDLNCIATIGTKKKQTHGNDNNCISINSKSDQHAEITETDSEDGSSDWYLTSSQKKVIRSMWKRNYQLEQNIIQAPDIESLNKLMVRERKSNYHFLSLIAPPPQQMLYYYQFLQLLYQTAYQRLQKETSMVIA